MRYQRKLSIYLVERPCREIDPEEAEWHWHHSFLALADETDASGELAPKPEQVFQELHYYNSHNWRMVPVVKPMKRPEKEFNQLKFSSCFDGGELDVVSMWNRALGFALNVRSLCLPFDQNYMHAPDSNNCRAGVKATLESVGLDFQGCAGVENAGLISNEINLKSTFDAAGFVDGRDLNEAWMLHSVLSDRLSPFHANRYDMYEL